MMIRSTQEGRNRIEDGGSKLKDGSHIDSVGPGIDPNILRTENLE
jgi:hypothetical protein